MVRDRKGVLLYSSQGDPEHPGCPPHLRTTEDHDGVKKFFFLTLWFEHATTNAFPFSFKSKMMHRPFPI